MNETYMILKNGLLEVYNLKKLNEFNDKFFSLVIMEKEYLIKGTELELLDINQEKGTLIIKGNIKEIICDVEKGTTKSKKDSSFFTKLFK